MTQAILLKIVTIFFHYVNLKWLWAIYGIIESEISVNNKTPDNEPDFIISFNDGMIKKNEQNN